MMSGGRFDRGEGGTCPRRVDAVAVVVVEGRAYGRHFVSGPLGRLRLPFVGQASCLSAVAVPNGALNGIDRLGSLSYG